MQRRRHVRRRRAGVLDRRRGHQRHRSSRAADAGFMVNWPFVWARAQTRSRTARWSVGARRLRLGALPAGGRGQAERTAATAGSTSASARSARTPTSPSRRPSASRPTRTRPTTSSPTATPPRRRRSTTTRRCSRSSRWPPIIRESLEPAAPAAADRLLQRGLRRPPARVPPAGVGVDPTDTGRGRPTEPDQRPCYRRRSCCDHDDASARREDRSRSRPPRRGISDRSRAERGWAGCSPARRSW